ncbi:LPXTG cell wall anchor domain-containing protein [Pontibacillus litoralis]|uniref:LPXTG cell wall anchor domain-containing protein n=1 Tax=Pontibacillus litoralis TaxID=516703 RepID=UPI0038CD1291
MGTKANESNEGKEEDGDETEGDDSTASDNGSSAVVKESETDNNEKSDNSTGEELPNTATNIFNIGLIGVSLLLTGISITLFRRFKKSEA